MMELSAYPHQESCLRVAQWPSAMPLERAWAVLREPIEDALYLYGAVLLRGTGIECVAQFAALSELVCPGLLSYRYRSTPRTDLGQNVYTTTEYPARLSIPQHNENAYQDDWPMRLMFCCVSPAEDGGQTPLSNIRAVTQAIPLELRQAFQQRGLRYVRHYHPGIDLSWQEVFQTDQPQQVEAFCTAHGIDWCWDGAGLLQTVQHRPALANHPKGELLWFNQAHLFHQSALAGGTRSALKNIYGDQALPRDVLFGDGSVIPDAVLEDIRAAYAAHTFVFDWQAQDVLLLDNMLVAHGRAPFRGERKVLVAMGQRYSESGAVD